MNIEEQIKIVKNMLLHAETQLLDYEAIAIETLLTAYEKENEVLRLKLRQLKRTRDLLSENWDLIFNDNEDEDTDI